MDSNTLNAQNRAEPGRYTVPGFTPAAIGQKTTTQYFTSGKGGQQLAMFDTAIEHSKQLGDAVDALNNGDIRAVNTIGNKIGVEFGNDAVTNFNVVKQALSSEVERLFAGGVATEGDRRELAAPINAANSPAQLRGAINQIVQLMNSRKAALQKQYKSGMRGQPTFGGAGGPAKGGSVVNDLINDYGRR